MHTQGRILNANSRHLSGALLPIHTHAGKQGTDNLATAKTVDHKRAASAISDAPNSGNEVGTVPT